MKVLFITPITYDSCSFYRCGGIAPDLRERIGLDIDVVSWDKEKFHWQRLLDYNLIMMQRPYTEAAYTMGGYTKDLGIPLWIDYDDFLLGVPPDNRAHKGMIKAADSIIKISGIADIITVSTPALRDQLLKYNKNIHVIPNAFNDYIFKERNLPAKRNKVIAWRGSETHFADITLMGVPLINAIKKNPEWTFMFLGFNPWFLGKHKNLMDLDPQDPILYFKNIIKISAAAFHVPLVDSIFNRCKSNIASIEAAYAGSLAIVPDWEEWRMPGALLYNDEKSFYSHLVNVIDGEVNIKKNSDRVWEYITDNLMLSKINLKRAEVIKSLLK